MPIDGSGAQEVRLLDNEPFHAAPRAIGPGLYQPSS